MIDGIQHIGKLLVIAGIIVAAIGGVILISGKIPWVGRLPGDILIQKKNFIFYFPLVTCIFLSVILTIIFWIIGKR